MRPARRLSEADRYAKTHRGVWTLFAQEFASSGRFDRGLVAAARRIQEIREASDYDAREIPAEQARALIGDADRFVTEVAAMLAD